MPADELESLLSVAETLQLSPLSSNENVPSQGEEEWQQGTAAEAQKGDLETQDTTIDRRPRTQPVALHQDYRMHKEVEIDDRDNKYDRWQ